MHAPVYDTPAWRALPRTRCRVAELLGDAVGPCRGVIDRHHVNPDDPNSRTVEVCHRHHPMLEKLVRGLGKPRRRCPHAHRYDHARRECEAKLNAV